MLQLAVGLLLLGAAFAQVQDQTRVSGAHGSDVVQAVVNQIRSSCIFPDDKLFLRRLAFVETHDGNDSKTYRAGYDGGIWQIDQDKFNQLRSKAAVLFPPVKSQFAIDWNTVQWSDLRKPLYSGLAAALYLSTIPENVSRIMEQQGPYYAKYFRTGLDSAHNFYLGAKGLNVVCARSNLDLAFIVDASASLSTRDFSNAKDFARDVVDDFNIGPQDVRVSFVTFSTGYKAEFDFNQYTDKDALKKAIDGIQMVPGRTDTDQALQFAANTLFTASSGSRAGASKVILLLTDGKSTYPDHTLPAALLARSKGIIIFTIGVGSDIDVQELSDIANTPSCTHVIQLATYSDLSALVSEIQQVSCEAAPSLPPGNYTYPCSKGGSYQFQTDGTTTQVTITTSDGQVDLYGSLTNPTPSQAVNSFSSSATNSASSVVLISQEYKPVYLSVKPPAAPLQCTGTYTIRVGGVEKVKANTLVSCVERDQPRACDVANIYGFIYTLLSPPYIFANPCQIGPPSFQAHPSDRTKFLFCNDNGKVFVLWCRSQIFDLNSFTLPNCVTSTTTSTTTTSTTANLGGYANPCSQANKDAGRFFFPYPPDKTKYIDCTNWPTLGFIKDCQKGRVWDQRDLTCTFDIPVVNATDLIFDLKINNTCKPCPPTLFYHPYPNDPHKFIHCDAFCDAFVKTCPNNEVWQQRSLTCMPGSFPTLPVG